MATWTSTPPSTLRLDDRLRRLSLVEVEVNDGVEGYVAVKVNDVRQGQVNGHGRARECETLAARRMVRMWNAAGVPLQVTRTRMWNARGAASRAQSARRSGERDARLAV